MEQRKKDPRAMVAASTMAVEKRGLELTGLKDLADFAEIVVKSGLDPQKGSTISQVIVKLQTGLELGFTPMQSLNAIYVVNGRAALETAPMVALVKSSGLCESFENGSFVKDKELVGYCRVKRVGDAKPVERTYTLSQAKQAGLVTKGPWQQYPERMVQHRATSWCLRDVFPDVVRGLITVEEARERVKAEPVTPDYSVLDDEMETLYGATSTVLPSEEGEEPEGSGDSETQAPPFEFDTDAPIDELNRLHQLCGRAKLRVPEEVVAVIDCDKPPTTKAIKGAVTTLRGFLEHSGVDPDS